MVAPSFEVCRFSQPVPSTNYDERKGACANRVVFRTNMKVSFKKSEIYNQLGMTTDQSANETLCIL